MTPQAYKYIFGPVLSRRMGRSLGIDIIPFKTCTYDCVYCEQGRTTHLTACKKEYVPVEEVLAELKIFLDSGGTADYITLSGAGEPTLHKGLGDIIQGIKALTRLPLAVITNGSLLWDAEVRNALHAADVVMPSLDAANEPCFRRIDRPVADVSFEKMVNGLIAFRDAFPNEIWLEIMLLDGISSDEKSVQEISALVRRIRPDRIQLNTVVRPPSESLARPVSREKLEHLAALFEPRAEIIANYSGLSQETDAAPDTARILELLKRRPCPLREIADALGMRVMETAKTVQYLVDQNKIEGKLLGEEIFFASVPESDGEAAK